MPEPQIVIVVNSLTEAHKLERELVRDRQNACGYRPRQKDECRFCKHVGRYSSYTYQTTYFCDLHNFCVAARGICDQAMELHPPSAGVDDRAAEGAGVVLVPGCRGRNQAAPSRKLCWWPTPFRMRNLQTHFS